MGVIQYGSTAGRAIKVETDVDLLIILESTPKDRKKRNELLKNAEKNLIDKLKDITGYHLYPSLNIKSLEQFKHFHSIYLDMVDQSLILFDPQIECKKIIQKTEDWIQKSGAKKIKKGLLWYWILDPNYRPGDEVKIGWE